MAPEFKKGISTGLIIYGTGIGASIVVHLIFGWTNPHSPPVSAVPILITLVTGTTRLITTLNNAVMEKSIRAKGELLIHLLMAVLIIGFILIEL